VGIVAWIVCDGGDVSDELASALVTAGDPLATITVEPSVGVGVGLAVDIVVDPAFVAADVFAAVAGALADPVSGLLAVRNIPIGGAVFRSAIARAVRDVAGVAEVRSILADGSDMPPALQAQPGHHLAFTVSVGGS
jgi:hypothetical protein